MHCLDQPSSGPGSASRRPRGRCRRRAVSVWLLALALPLVLAQRGAVAQEVAEGEAQLLSGIRQLTFAGRRAGEGYFSADGQRMVFQSERDPSNPFFQIYLLDFTTGDIQQVSPGTGKTTCAWIHPDGQRVLFASTHQDPEAEAKQKQELKDRAEGKTRRYSWDYDPHFDLYVKDLGSGQLRRLTDQTGYDAEGSYSPDGQWIAFASNRQAYDGSLDDAQIQRREIDPSYFMEIYLMRSDGTGLRRLTDVPGYDGGPFFSPDGQRICWRRFSEDGVTAEIFTMKLDGSDVRQLTRLGAMSWAPFYHPSGRYLIFATNLHGFGNFELYLVDAQGEREPVRVTYTDGFDGLPVFSPDGNQLAWTTNRTPSGQSQIFVADWDHQRALEMLKLASTSEPARDATAVDSEGRADEAEEAAEAALEAQRAARAAEEAFSAADIMRHVDYLCRPELGGRFTGSPGERLATAYVAAYFDQLGLRPAGYNGSWFAPFTFTSGVELGKANRLTANGRALELNRDWRPVAFSQTGPVEAAPLVFAGYGIQAPAGEDQEEYDSYVHLDIQGRWVMVLRFLPENLTPERRQYLARYSSLRHKTMVARDLGAAGLVVVTGPNSQVREELIPLQTDGTLSGSSLPVVSVTREVAEQWVAGPDRSLKSLQDALDDGTPRMGVALDQVQLASEIDIHQVQQEGRNVLARLPAGEQPSEQCIVVGAHIDHLGTGNSAGSLAREDERHLPHLGADDNASGVAAMLEIAQWLVAQRNAGRLPMQRDVVFAAWSGEELGLLGSGDYTKRLAEQIGESGSIYPAVAACINLDMVGRFDKNLILQGVGSSSQWRGMVEQRNAVVGLPVQLQEDSYLPTDASSFYLHGVPILSAFTGSHRDYHTPRDTPDKLNYPAAARIARLMGLITRGLVAADAPPDYQEQTAPENRGSRAALRAYLGTIPDYAPSAEEGVPLSGVSSGGPADKAGLKAGDTIVELAGRKIANIYDYTYAIEALKIGEEVKIVVLRDGQRVTLSITPESRQ